MSILDDARRRERDRKRLAGRNGRPPKPRAEDAYAGDQAQPISPEAAPVQEHGDAWEGPAEEESPPPCLQLDEIDAAALADSPDDPELQYLRLLDRPGYFVRGWSHLLAGYPRCGKTELLTECCRGFIEDGETVLYLSEEPRSVWRQRVSRVAGPWAGIRLVFALGTTLVDLLARMGQGDETVVVIDTIRNLGILPEDENDNAAIAHALAPWVAAARRKGKTLVLNHHMRKGAGDHGEGISGGHALLGSVDVALELRRDSCPRRRIIRAYARLIQPEELCYELTPAGRLVALGSPSGVTFTEVKQRVFAALDDTWLKTAEVRERLDDPKPGAELVRRALLAAAMEGSVERQPPTDVKEVAGKTVCWRLRQPA